MELSTPGMFATHGKAEAAERRVEMRIVFFIVKDDDVQDSER